MMALATFGLLQGPGAWARERSDREEDGLVGAVATVETHEEFLVQTDRYDSGGRILERVQNGVKPGPGLWPLRFVYEYDPAGRRISEKILDGRGELVKETRTVYDDRGNRVAEVAAWGDGTFENASFYEFDGDRRMMLGLHYNAPLVVNRNTYGYDDQGRLVRETFARNYRYDAGGGRVVSSALFDYGYEVTTTYDGRGLVREKLVTDLTGVRQSRSEFTHDDRGNQIEERVFSANGTLTDRKEYRYEYDLVGNWTKETMNWWSISKGVPQLIRTHVRTRTITYH